MDVFAWTSFLAEYNDALLHDARVIARLPVDVAQSQWLGFPGATEEQLTQAEERLKTRLPPSYRNFLRASNGWRQIGIFRHELWPAESIDWFATHNQAWIDDFTEERTPAPAVSNGVYFNYGRRQSPVSMRPHYLQTALQISNEWDGGVYLLNPKIVTTEGEWEAWFFANWHAGAVRFRSFDSLMQNSLECIRSHQGKVSH